MRKISLKSFMAALLLAAISNGAHADYPERVIRFVVTTAPGTSGDIIARLLTPKLSERLKQTIIVENKPGANGNLAASPTPSRPFSICQFGPRQGKRRHHSLGSYPNLAAEMFKQQAKLDVLIVKHNQKRPGAAVAGGHVDAVFAASAASTPSSAAES